MKTITFAITLIFATVSIHAAATGPVGGKTPTKSGGRVIVNPKHPGATAGAPLNKQLPKHQASKGSISVR